MYHVSVRPTETPTSNMPYGLQTWLPWTPIPTVHNHFLVSGHWTSDQTHLCSITSTAARTLGYLSPLTPHIHCIAYAQFTLCPDYTKPLIMRL